MAIKSSGTLSFSSDLAGEFEDSVPYRLSDYYRGSGLVPDIATNINVPSSGSIAFSSFYNAVKIIPAVIPAGAIIFYDTTLAAPTPPVGWNLYNTGNDRFVEATSTQTAIGPGTDASVSSQTSSNTFSGSGGSHGNIGSTFTRVDSMSIVTGRTMSSPSVDGNHSHSISSTNISGRGVPYPPLKRLVPLIAGSNQESLPQNAIIFRSTIPGATNWSQITASQNSAIMMGKSSSFNSGNDSVNGINRSWTGTSGSNGSHSHRASNTRGNTLSGYVAPVRSQLTSGSHTHSIIYSLSVRVRQKILKAWKTAISNIATDDFILLFAGDFSALPSGWNCCNGRDGTESLDGWIIGIGAAATAQGSTVAATEMTLSNQLNQITVTHSHGPATATNRFVASDASSYHTSAGWNHTHGITNQVFTSGYQPPTVRLGFIQYKGRLKQPYTPGDYVESQGGFYVGDIRHPNGNIYDLFIANSFDLILPGQPRIGRQWQTENTQRPLPTGMSILQTGYDGAANTNYYASAGGYPAAEFCANLVHEGKDDWYLPSIFELQVIFTHLKPTIEENVQGVVTNPPYWMSSIGLTRLNYNPYRVGGNGNFVGTATLPAQTTVDFFKGENTSEGIAAQQPQNMASIGLKGSVWSSTPAAANSSIDVANAAYAFVFSWTNVGGGGVNAGRADGNSSKSIAYTLLPMRRVLRP